MPIWAFGYLTINHIMQFAGWGILNVGAVSHLGAIFGPVVVVPLGDATAHAGFWGLMVYCAVPGALLPALLTYFTSVKQKEAILEEVST